MKSKQTPVIAKSAAMALPSESRVAMRTKTKLPTTLAAAYHVVNVDRPILHADHTATSSI
jgi:hypothetical protein